ncbi:MAG: phospholipase [Planctomycetes bacterium]|nr:phospholipase [Planctomycetota bacterium]
MTDALVALSSPVLDHLMCRLRTGALRLPCTAADLAPIVPDGVGVRVAAALNALGLPGAPTSAAVGQTAVGAGSQAAAAALDLVLAERGSAGVGAPRADLVWSGPEAEGSLNRDTAIVIQELFSRARRSVLIASFALDGGEKARAIFHPLAARLDRGDPLDVTVVVNVHPSADVSRAPEAVIADFARRFRADIWPGRLLPRVLYDPRSLVVAGPVRASMHAKCVVIDEQVAFVTSANFTEAAQHRNVEVGVVVESASLARSLVAQFGNLARDGSLCEMPLPRGPVMGGT